MTTQVSPLWKEFAEYVRPNHVIITLNDGRKLQVSENRRIKGGARAYQMILQLFDSAEQSDKRTQIINGLIDLMVRDLDGVDVKFI